VNLEDPRKSCRILCRISTRDVHTMFLSGVRILDGPMTDSLEAMAFNSKMHINDIYSCRSVSMMKNIFSKMQLALQIESYMQDFII